MRRLASRAWARWEALWFAEGSALNLGLFRILFACALLFELPTTMVLSSFAIEGGVHVPYVDWIRPVSEATYRQLHTWQLPFIALLGLGLFPRPAAAALLTLQGYVFFADYLNFRNHPYFFLLILFALVFAPSGESVSVRALFRSWKAGRLDLVGRARPLTFQRLIQAQLCIVYLYAAVHKCNSAFLGGHVLSRYALRALPRHQSNWMDRWLSPETIEEIRAFLSVPENLVVASYGSAFLEFALPFALLWRKTRTAAFVVGLGFHLTIALTMHIPVFSLAMMASYLLFRETTHPRAR